MKYKKIANTRLKIGISILFLSFFVGWGGVAACSAIYLRSNNTIWLKLAGFLYIFSWALVLLSLIVGGKEAYSQFKSIINRVKNSVTQLIF